MTIDQLALKKLSEAFDRFVTACLDENGKPKAPDYRAIMQARASLPPYCVNAFQKKGSDGVAKNGAGCDLMIQATPTLPRNSPREPSPYELSLILSGVLSRHGFPSTRNTDCDLTKIGEGSDFRIDHYLLPPLNNDTPPDYEDYHSNPIESEYWGSARPALCPNGCNGAVTSTIDGFPRVKCKVCGTEWEVE